MTKNATYCPKFSPPIYTAHRGLKESRSSNTSTVEGKEADCVRCTASALSGGSAAPASLATPLPLVDFGAMAAGGGGQETEGSGNTTAASKCEA